MRSLLLALFTALLPLAAAAQLLTTGVGPGGFGSSAAVYDPGGVLFFQEGSARYVAGGGNLNGGTDTRHGIIAFRHLVTFGVATGGGSPPDDWRSSMNFGNYSDGTCAGESCKGFMINQDAASWVTNGVGFTLRNTIAGSNNGAPPNPGTAVQKTAFAFNNVWQSIVVFYDMNAAAGSRKYAIFVDGVQVTCSGGCQTDTGVAFDVNWNTANGVCINYCNRTSGLQTGGALYMADIIVDTKNALPSGCPATGASCQAVVDAFYNSGTGKPVNPGTSSSACDTFVASYSGADPKPDWCLRGDKTAFLANTGGNAQAMSLVNGIAASPLPAAIYNAPYGQGNEPTDRPYLAWAAPQSENSFSTSSTTSCTAAGCESGVVGNYGNQILTGDRIFIAWENCYTSSAPSGTLPTLSAGWSFVTTSTNTNPTNDQGTNPRCAWLLATHVAASNYVTLNNPWQAGAPVDPPTITYTTTGTSPRKVNFLMFVYRSTNGTVNIDASDCLNLNRNGGASASFVTPSITTVAAKTTMFSLSMSKFNNVPMTPPASEDLRHHYKYTAAGNPIIELADEVISSAGATGTRTWAQSGTPSTNDRAYMCLVALKNS